ncbi:DUF2188 domain-containing protein [Stutzerimonas stutzeri]|uniref:DUF2188 domain-containing protein n=1 Tax=Stutzerimonas sp. S1 TaxID=3030652 RepID=UPI0022247105|nr:DUF2188 domain-containing protein [Stutzerimonas sp. S1]MCW3148318.1 DUF2188 domain-containing protein [Stutzerimonas sp. S1]
MQNYHITREGERWLLREEGDRRVLIETASRDEILREARDYMKLRTAMVRVHGDDGGVEEEHRYPEEQNPLASRG